MLYERWRAVAADCRDQFALRDVASGRSWTFAELFTAGESRPAPPGPISFPQGQSADFILDLLAAWREGKVACPLEAGQSPLQCSPPPASCIHLKTTSATTGSPRLVAFTAEQLAADADNVVATMGLRADWPNLGVISLAHSYGFSNLVTPLVLHGVPLILTSAPLPETVRQSATLAPDITLPAVPAMWRAWHEVNAIPANVRLAISAGAPLPLALEQEVFASRGLKIHNFYGASECGGIAYDDSDHPRSEPEQAGRPMQNVTLSTNEDGCLIVSGANVAHTYWPGRDDALGAERFLTRDLAELRNGKVFLRGRAGDVINVAGRKVSPESIERVLLQHPDVRECLVLGVPSRDAERAEEIVVVVVSREREPVLREFVLKSLPAWQTPRHWWFVDDLQTTARGKLSRAEWRNRFIQERANQRTNHV